VKNTGQVPLTNVIIKDPLAPDCEKNVSSLADGNSITYTCTIEDVQECFLNDVTVTGKTETGQTVEDKDCAKVLVKPVLAEIDIKKYTNGEDANSPTGPIIDVGDPVLWDYIVTNIGPEPLTEVEVTDTILGDVNCPENTLNPTQTMICTVIGTAEEGQYANIRTVTARDPYDNEVTDSDPSHYLGVTPPEADIKIEKLTNGFDADTPPGPSIPEDDPVEWTYIVTNIGSLPLDKISVTDSVSGVDPNCFIDPNTFILDPNKSITCKAFGTAGEGQYANIGTVTAFDPNNNEVTDSDPSHYYGVPSGVPTIQLTKTIEVPFCAANDRFLDDKIIPVAAPNNLDPNSSSDPNCNCVDPNHNLFYFLVTITVESCGCTDLTGVEVIDTFSNEAFPYYTSDPNNVIIISTLAAEIEDSTFHKETLIWSVGNLPAIDPNRTLQIKVGTQFNPSGKVEPTSAPQSIFYNGRNFETGSASVTADGGLSASVDAVLITNGNQISCVNTDGCWDKIPEIQSDKYSQIITPLPITLIDSDSQ